MPPFSVHVYTPANKNPIVISVVSQGIFQILDKKGNLKNKGTNVTNWQTKKIMIPASLKPLFQKFAACQNTITIDTELNFVQGVPLLTYRAWIWHSMLLVAGTTAVKERLASIWGAGVLASETLASDAMANLENVPYSADSLSGLISFATQSAVGEYPNADLNVETCTFDAPDYEPYDGYANLYSLITDFTHLSVSGTTTASSMGSAAHMAAEIAFSSRRRNARRTGTALTQEERRIEESRKMVSMAAPLAAECGYTLANLIKKKYNGANYKGSDVPFVLNHLLRNGDVFVGFPDAVFESGNTVLSTEFKTRWGAENGLVSTHQSFKKAYAQTLLQALAARQHFAQRVTAVLAIAQVPKQKFVKKIKCVVVETKVTDTVLKDSYHTLLEYLGSTPANSKRPNTFADNYSAMLIKSSVYRSAVVENAEIYVFSHSSDTMTGTWTLYSPMNNGPGKPTTIDTPTVSFTDFPATASQHGAVMISCKPLEGNTAPRLLRSGVNIGAPSSYSIEWVCQSVEDATAFTDVLKTTKDNMQRNSFKDVVQTRGGANNSRIAHVKATGTVHNNTLATFELLANQKFLPDKDESSRKLAWAERGVDRANSLVWLPDLFRL